VSRARIPALDAARALGVVAMVFGHTLDALLAPAVRATPAVELYWKARGLTAPLFLVVSGWAVAVAIGRSPARGVALVRGRLPRVLLLLAVGYALRWPGWGLERLASGDLEVWAHLLAFDALHTIAVSLLVAASVLALPLAARERALLFGALALLAVTLGLLPPAPLPRDAATLASSIPALALAQAAGGTSPFPLFPWAAYFFVGAVLGELAASGGALRVRGMAAIGTALVAATCWTGVGVMPMGHPLLVLFRIGAILIVLAALSAVPARAAAAVAPLGRASLGVYALHVPLVYGWSTLDGLTARVGPALGLGAAVLVALAVLGASFGLQRALVAGRRAASAGVRLLRARLASVRALAGDR
jgi:uncharacterized membrane protein